MKLQLGNAWAKVTEATEAERYWLDGYLTFEDTSRFFIKGRKGWGDGKLHVYDKRRRAFPTGLVSMVVTASAKEGITVELGDDRVEPCPCHECAHEQAGNEPTGMVHRCDPLYVQQVAPWLYDYQQDSVARVAEHTRGILHIPTGGGKTEIAIGCTLTLPCNWLLLVHRKGLMHQARQRYEKRTGWYGGIVGDGIFDPDPDGCFTAATFQTVSKGLRSKDAEVIKLLADAEGLIVDESHTLPAAKFWATAMATRRAYYRVGLSGTPLVRGDKRSVYAVAALGPVIHRILPETLIQAGVLARPHIRMVPLEQHCHAQTWQGAYSQLVVKSTARNALVVDMVRAAAKPAFCFVKQVSHGHALTKALNEMGIRSEFQWGEKSSPEREAAVKRLRFGDIDVIVCSVIFQEGLDVPELEAVVNGAGMKSAIAAVQRLGRGMRSDDGRKSTFELWDVKDEGNRFLVRHTGERVRAYKAEGHSLEIVSRNSCRHP